MKDDLNHLLAAWAFDPSKVSARRIEGLDGRAKIQLRLDLGVLQMEVADRPDGRTPHGFPTLLDYHLDREGAAEFTLTTAECMELQQEAAQFYYRYVACYAMGDFAAVARDTQHNLCVIDLVDRHVEDDELAWQFIQFFPYVRMMNARGQAEHLAASRKVDEALAAVDEGIREIEEFWREQSDDDATGHDREIKILQELAAEFRKARPRSESDRLQEELAHAIATENYERAAALRDALRAMVRP